VFKASNLLGIEASSARGDRSQGFIGTLCFVVVAAQRLGASVRVRVRAVRGVRPATLAEPGHLSRTPARTRARRGGVISRR
jgi:hypothetical protein